MRHYIAKTGFFMTDRDIPNSVEECRAILRRYHQAREQSRKLHGHRDSLDDKIDDLTHQINADRKLFLEERSNELGKLLGAKQALMLKLKQTRLEVDHWLDAVEEMEERSNLITERLVDLLFSDDPKAEEEYHLLKKTQIDSEHAVAQLSKLTRNMSRIVDNLRYANEIASGALGRGMLRFLYFWRTPTRIAGAHLEQVNTAAVELTHCKPIEPWLANSDFNHIQTIAQALIRHYDSQWGFRTIQEVYTPLRIELETLQQKTTDILLKTEQAASNAHEQLQTWLLGRE